MKKYSGFPWRKVSQSILFVRDANNIVVGDLAIDNGEQANNNADLIISAVNSCAAINPDAPELVAVSLDGIFREINILQNKANIDNSDLEELFKLFNRAITAK